MAQTLESIKGGGGSIKIGTVGTISSLITRELQSTGFASPTSSATVLNPPTVESSTCCSNSSPKPKTSLDEASSSGTTGSNVKHSSVETTRRGVDRNQHRIPARSPTHKRQKEKKLPDVASSRSSSKGIGKKVPEEVSSQTRSYRRAHHMPMLASENIVLDKTPTRVKLPKKGTSIVDIVDVNCGSPSLANRLKKLGFSKLSESFS